MEKYPTREDLQVFLEQEYSVFEKILLQSSFGSWFLKEYKNRILKPEADLSHYPEPLFSQTAYRATSLHVQDRLQKAALTLKKLMESPQEQDTQDAAEIHSSHNTKHVSPEKSIDSSSQSSPKKIGSSRIVLLQYKTSKELEDIDLFKEDEQTISSMGEPWEMKIATWNVNGIRARLSGVVAWLKNTKPDIACLQEIKCETAVFPKEVFEDLGYSVAHQGQKGFNGVAILSRFPLEDIRWSGLPKDEGEEDSESRYIEALVTVKKQVIRIGCLYLPNGNPLGGEKYIYKLRWMDRSKAHAVSLLDLEEPFILAGDYNVIPEAIDAKNPKQWQEDALFSEEVRFRYFSLLAAGFSDALRLVYPSSVPLYTFWDYQGRSWEKNNGIRIDHCLLSPQAADKLLDVSIDQDQRAISSPSDHVPLIVTLSF